MQICAFRLRLDGCQDVSSLQTTVPAAARLSKPDPAAKVCVSYLRGGADTTVGAAVLYFLRESGGSIEPISRFTNLVALILFSSPSRARFAFRSPSNCIFARCPIWTPFRFISIPQNSLTKKSKLMHKLLSCYQLLMFSWMAESSYLTYCHI